MNCYVKERWGNGRKVSQNIRSKTPTFSGYIVGHPIHVRTCTCVSYMCNVFLAQC